MGNYHDIVHHREYVFDNDHNERSVFDDLIDEPDHDDSVDNLNDINRPTGDEPAADAPTSHPATDLD